MSWPHWFQALGLAAAVAIAASHRELLPRQLPPVHTRRRTHARGLLHCGNELPPLIAG